jgi:hypothetical protein
MDQSQFPWRPLGALLVEEGLLSAANVEQALGEQRRTGRLLGEIVVQRGLVSGANLARALAKQHLVELRPSSSVVPPAPHPVAEVDGMQPKTWRPLGRVLVENGFVSAGALEEALRIQAEQPDRRLGELLVERGTISGRGLALALAEQHGVSVGRDELDGDVEALITTSTPDEPRYEVWDVAYDPAYERRSVLFETTNFLEAADYACELVDREQPEALEIQRRDNGASETVWTYSQQRAAAVAASRTSVTDRFGFDPARWGNQT